MGELVEITLRCNLAGLGDEVAADEGTATPEDLRLEFEVETQRASLGKIFQVKVAVSYNHEAAEAKRRVAGASRPFGSSGRQYPVRGSA